MHDYVKGAFEALSWIRSILKERRDAQKALQLIEEALNDINDGAAIDFRERLRPIRF